MICIYNFKQINDDGFLLSACFLNYKNQNNIITCNYKFNNIPEPIKIFDFNGNKIKEINGSKECTFFIDVYYDNNISKTYIITGNKGIVKSYDYDENKLYHNYYDNNNKCHYSIIINDDEKIIKLMESSFDGNIRIWDFHSGELLKKIKLSDKGLVGICFWNNEYIFVGCDDKTIKLINVKEGIIIKNLNGHNNCAVTIKKIYHPKYGKCLISQGSDFDSIKLWVISKN